MKIKRLPVQVLFIILLVLGFTNVCASQDRYKLKSSRIRFVSEAPQENIEADNLDGIGIVDFDKKSFTFRVPIASFKFKRRLMQEHFNENYMESEKYPNGTFKGVLEGTYNLRVNGVYALKAVGNLDIHGVSQRRIIPCTLTVKNGTYNISSDFIVKLDDHDIKVPSVVFNKISEEILVIINGELEEMK